MKALRPTFTLTVLASCLFALGGCGASQPPAPPPETKSVEERVKEIESNPNIPAAAKKSSIEALRNSKP